jgi:hypothetical protein
MLGRVSATAGIVVGVASRNVGGQPRVVSRRDFGVLEDANESLRHAHALSNDPAAGTERDLDACGRGDNEK